MLCLYKYVSMCVCLSRVCLNFGPHCIPYTKFVHTTPQAKKKQTIRTRAVSTRYRHVNPYTYTIYVYLEFRALILVFFVAFICCASFTPSLLRLYFQRPKLSDDFAMCSACVRSGNHHIRKSSIFLVGIIVTHWVTCLCECSCVGVRLCILIYIIIQLKFPKAKNRRKTCK